MGDVNCPELLETGNVSKIVPNKIKPAKPANRKSVEEKGLLGLGTLNGNRNVLIPGTLKTNVSVILELSSSILLPQHHITQR